MINAFDDRDQNLYEILLSDVNHIQNMMKISDELLLLGDFNLPTIKWVFNDDDVNYLPINDINFRESSFLNSIFSSGLHQMSGVKNDLGRQLDLVFFSDSDNMVVEPCSTAMTIVDKYHPPLQATLCLDSENKSGTEELLYAFNFKKANFNELSWKLSSYDFCSLLSSNDINVDVAKFYSVLFDVFTSCVPFERQRLPRSSPPWFNSELRQMKNQKNKLWKMYMRSGDPASYDNFVDCYNRFRELSSRLYDDYLISVKDKLYSDPRTFFKFINIKKKTDNYPNTLQFEDSCSSDASVISDMFASFFNKSFAPTDFLPDDNNFGHLNSHPVALDVLPSITPEAILNHINELPNDYTSGPDSIPTVFLKSCAVALLTPLRIIFQKSLNSGQFPTLWKSSFIIPVHKKGSKSDISNYRPIAKLSCIPKLFESVMYSQIAPLCKELVSTKQHGFLAGRSTTTNLLEFSSYIIDGFEEGVQTDCIYTDFSKAFDKLSHSVIIYKLKKLGFPRSFIMWIQSYLSDRSYQVIFRGSKSKTIKASSGVPQGSHLGPLLFILSIDDVVGLFKYCKVLIYADDIKIFFHVRDTQGCNLVQSDLNNFFSWCLANNLELNIAKCEVMTFCRRRNPIPFDYTFLSKVIRRVDLVNDLGVKFDGKLDFITHINCIVSKGSSMLGFIKRWSREFNSILVSKQLYTSLVRPLLEYASQVWAPYYSSHIESIESVQRKFVRHALRHLPWNNPLILPTYESRLALLNMTSLQRRREVSDVVFVHQLLNDVVDSAFLKNRISFRNSDHNLRSLPLLHIRPTRTNYGRFAPTNRMCINVNNNADVFNIHVGKGVLKTRLFNVR